MVDVLFVFRMELPNKEAYLIVVCYWVGVGVSGLGTVQQDTGRLWHGNIRIWAASHA